MTLYSVLFADPMGGDPSALGRFIAADKKIPLMDAQRLARRSWGFLGRDLSDVDASSLVERLGAAGFRAIAVETTSIPSLMDPAIAHGILMEPARAVLRVGLPSIDRPLPFGKISLLSVASLRRDQIVTKMQKNEVSAGRRLVGLGVMLTTMIPVGMGKSKEIKKTVTETEWILFLDIWGDNGRWRVVPASFDFAGLGEAKGMGGSENLRRLLILLHERAPSAILNRGARWWLEGKPLHTAGYDDLDDVDTESRWLLALSSKTP